MSSLANSALDIPTRFQPDLLPGESILWTGQPSPRVIFHPSDWFAIPFSLMWGGFALFWIYGASGYGRNADQSVLTHGAQHLSLFALWGIPFVLIGQYMIWGRFFYTAWKKTRTFYAVTNKRVIVLNAQRNRKVTDAFLAGLSSVSLTTRSDDVGTIEFAPEPERVSNWYSNNRNRGGLQMDIDLTRLGFFDVPDAKSVYQMIQSQRARQI
jgi:hypothetical protein